MEPLDYSTALPGLLCVIDNERDGAKGMARRCAPTGS